MISRLLVLVLAVAAAACDKVPLTAPSSSTITVSAAARTVGLGSSMEVSAFVAESSGTPVQNGTTVRFTTNLGRVDPVEAQTRNGVATTTFLAGDQSGTAQIRATSGGVGGATGSGTNAATNVVEVQVGAAAAATVAVSAQPSSLPVGGGTTTIIASVLDASGNRLRGVPVTFTTDVGSLSSSSATTDSNGDATVQLTTPRTAVVTARANAATTAASGTVTVRVATANGVTLSAPTPNPALAGQAVSVTITPPAADTNATVPNVSINWGDGTVESLGLVASPRTVSHVYNSTGTFQITATATSDGASVPASTAVTVNPRPNFTVTLAADDTTLTVNQPATFTATVAGGDASAVVSSYRWDILNASGGTEAEFTTGGNQITRSFPDTGIRTVIVTVTFSDGRTATSRINVIVS
jgi:adhesin/invasin